MAIRNFLGFGKKSGNSPVVSETDNPSNMNHVVGGNNNKRDVIEVINIHGFPVIESVLQQDSGDKTGIDPLTDDTKPAYWNTNNHLGIPAGVYAVLTATNKTNH